MLAFHPTTIKAVIYLLCVFLPKDNQVWLNYFVEGITLEETLIVPLQRSVR